MKTRILAATLSALVPGKRNGVSARPSTMTTSSTVSQRLPGRSWERSRFSMSGSSSVRYRIQPLRPPQQHDHHQPDVREHRDLRREEAGVVGEQPDQQRTDETTQGRAEAADDDDDEDQHV